MYLKVKVIASSNKEQIEQLSDNSYRIAVKEPAERNMANVRICKIIASLYDTNVSSVRIINGHHSPSKLISIINRD